MNNNIHRIGKNNTYGDVYDVRDRVSIMFIGKEESISINVEYLCTQLVFLSLKKYKMHTEENLQKAYEMLIDDTFGSIVASFGDVYKYLDIQYSYKEILGQCYNVTKQYRIIIDD